MPELPEVETIKRDLEPSVRGQRILRVEAKPDPRYRELEHAVGKRIEAVRRRGKYLLFDLGETELVIHLGMTGRLGFAPELPPLGHLRVNFRLEEGWLYFNDPRRFGKVFLVPKGEYASMPTLAEMGPEPFENFSFEPFFEQVRKVSSIKPALLSQRIVAGLGNIYVDEALFLAGIHPERGKLEREEAERLFRAIPDVLALAIERRGTTLRDYRDGRGQYGTNQDFLRVFDRTGEPCPRCGTAIEKKWVGGRGTHYCPHCQVYEKRTTPHN